MDFIVAGDKTVEYEKAAAVAGRGTLESGRGIFYRDLRRIHHRATRIDDIAVQHGRAKFLGCGDQGKRQSDKNDEPRAGCSKVQCAFSCSTNQQGQLDLVS